jgi:hypothetical protein
VFFVRVANKGVRVDAASRKVTRRKAERLELTGARKRSKKDNAETRRAQRSCGDDEVVGKGQRL